MKTEESKIINKKQITCTVADIAAPIRNAIVGGPFGSDLVSKDYTPTGVPVIRGANMGFGRWVSGDFVYVSQEKAEKLSANCAQPGDIIFTQRGTIGQVAIIPKSGFSRYLISQSQMKLTIDPQKVDALFLYYVFSSPEQQEYIRTNAIQTGVPHTNLGILKKTPIKIPPLLEQKRIATIVGGLDDKIDLNRRINQTLEAMAQAIFKSWFVDFDPVKAKIAALAEGRDPLRAAMSAISGKPEEELDALPTEGFEQLAATAALFPDEMVESELGEIPKGWAYATAESLADVGIGKTPPRKEPQWFTEGSGDWRWVSIKDMGAGTIYQQASSEYLTKEAVSRFKVRIVPANTVLLSFKLTVGRVAISDGELVTNEAIAHFKFTPNSLVTSEYLYFYLKNFDFTSLGSTSSIADAVNSKTIRNLPILTPHKNLIERMGEAMQPLLWAIKKHQTEILTLSELRDTLLPKLLSGELCVSEIPMEYAK